MHYLGLYLFSPVKVHRFFTIKNLFQEEIEIFKDFVLGNNQQALLKIVSKEISRIEKEFGHNLLENLMILDTFFDLIDFLENKTRLIFYN